VYAWIWRKLPFGRWGKLTGSLLLVGAVSALLWFVVFPWATPLLPFDNVQVGTNAGEQTGPAEQDPNVVIPGDDGAVSSPGRQTTKTPTPTPSR
jgi:hypothetical protein